MELIGRKMENNTSVFLQVFGNSPLIRILDFFLDNRMFDYTKSTISRGSGVSRMTLDCILPHLMVLGIVKKTRKISNSDYYKLNKESKLTKNLIKLDYNISSIDIPLQKKETPMAVRK